MYFDDLMIQALQYRLLQAWSRGGRGGYYRGSGPGDLWFPGSGLRKLFAVLSGGESVHE